MLQKLSKLRDIIENCDGALVAFSGGVDSSFLLKVCADVLDRGKLLAVTAKSSVIPLREILETQNLASSLGVRHEMVDFDELSVEQFSSNSPDRCYHCKKAIFSLFIEKAKANGLQYVFDGSNLDDTGDYRPGMRALAELSIRSPLKEAGLTKSDIRALSKEMGLDTWDKPSLACLASRFPYGEEITKSKLQRVALAEDILWALGFTQFRVRSHGDLARIEIKPEEIDRFLEEDLRDKVAAQLKKVGFSYVALDLSGYRTGSMNEVLEEGEKATWKI